MVAIRLARTRPAELLWAEVSMGESSAAVRDQSPKK